MRVAFITDKLLFGGKERRLVEIIRGLKSRNNVEPVIILWDGNTADDSIFYKGILDLQVPIYYLGGGSHFKKSKGLFQILMKERIEAINMWAPPVYSYFLVWPQVKLGIPVYNSSITGAGDGYSRKQKAVAHCLHYISRIVNSNSARAMEVFNIPKAKSKVIYNGFDFSRIANLQPAEKIREHFNILTKYIVSMAGRYDKSKDWCTHIKAAMLILEKGYDVTFLCMGGGDASPYETLIPSSYRNNIRFIGCQRDVESIMSASDIVTLATLGEGISNCLLEGMAVGKPIVTTNCGGSPEIVEDGKSGYLTAMCDPVDYSEHIMILLDNDELRKSMGEYGLSIVKRKFNIEQMIVGFENMLMYGI